MLKRPHWWSWELVFSTHLQKRMVDRQFDAVDVRAMVEDATDFRQDHEPGRWALLTSLAGRPWVVIVEPDDRAAVLVVVTAYPVE